MKQALLAWIICLLSLPLYGVETRNPAGNPAAWMETVNKGFYSPCLGISETLYTLSTDRKIGPNDTNVLDVVIALGQLGTTLDVHVKLAAEDFAGIRHRSVLTLAAVGGDYARQGIISIGNAEKLTVNLDVVKECIRSLEKLGNDKAYNSIKCLMFMYRYMPKVESAGGKENLFAFLSCIEKLGVGAPPKVLSDHMVVETLRDLVNTDTRYRVYSQELQKKAQAVLQKVLVTP